MTNEYGLDVDYFSRWINRLEDLSRYKPSELSRELARMAITADKSVLLEPEFNVYVKELREENERLISKLKELSNE